MKYGKSAFPYVTLLLILLIGMPLANWQIEKEQQVIVEVKIEKWQANKQYVFNSEKKPETLSLTPQ